MRPWIVALVAVIAGIAIALLLITDKGGVSEELRLPLLAVICVVTVLMALAFVSTIFASSNLQATQHALALPEGSVRALIALSLIVVFAVITMFVLVRFSRAEVQCVECQELVDALKQQGTRAESASTTLTDTTAASATTATTATTGTEITTTTAAGGTQTLETAIENPSVPATTPTDPITAAVAKRMEAGQDLAKQLLTMLGTLLAAISSFYFGASSTAAASDPSKLKEMGKAVDELRKG
jgi:hypothetical protein